MKDLSKGDTRVGGGCRAGVIRTLSGLVLLASAVVSVPSVAHHSFAMFDSNRRVTLTGTITEFQWTNPHAELFLMLQAPEGDTAKTGDVWRLESDSPEVLRKDFGLRRDMFHVGDKVTVIINPLRDGVPGGHILSWTLPDGTTHVRPGQ